MHVAVPEDLFNKILSTLGNAIHPNNSYMQINDLMKEISAAAVPVTISTNESETNGAAKQEAATNPAEENTTTGNLDG